MATNSHLFERRQTSQTPMRSRSMAPAMQQAAGQNNVQRAKGYLDTGKSALSLGTGLYDTFTSPVADAATPTFSFDPSITESVLPAGPQVGSFELGGDILGGAGTSVFSDPTAVAGAAETAIPEMGLDPTMANPVGTGKAAANIFSSAIGGPSDITAKLGEAGDLAEIGLTTAMNPYAGGMAAAQKYGPKIMKGMGSLLGGLF